MSTTVSKIIESFQDAAIYDATGELLKIDGIPGPITKAAVAAVFALYDSAGPNAPWPPQAAPAPAGAQGTPTAASIIATIEGHDISLNTDGSITYTAKAAIDGDGSGGNSYNDPDFQDATSLKVNGVSLNAESEAYIVVPPAILDGVPQPVLGSQAFVSFGSDLAVAAVVGDIGPHTKLGEISIACAQALGIPSSPLSGGVPSGVSYRILPGVPARANGRTYPLQPS